MKFSINPKGAAGMFLLSSGLGDHASREAQDRLAALLKEYWIGGFQSGVEHALDGKVSRETLAAATDAMRRSDQ